MASPGLPHPHDYPPCYGQGKTRRAAQAYQPAPFTRKILKNGSLLKRGRHDYAGPDGGAQTPPLQASPDAQSVTALQAAPGAPVFPGPLLPCAAAGAPVVPEPGDEEVTIFGSTQYPPLHESPLKQSELWVQSLLKAFSTPQLSQFSHGLHA